MDEGSCSSEAYTESEDDDVDKEYSTDNDIHDDDGSYDSGEGDIEGLDDNSENYSDGSEHDSKINANIKDDKVLQQNVVLIPNIVNEAFSMMILEGPSKKQFSFIVALYNLLLASLCYYLV